LKPPVPVEPPGLHRSRVARQMTFAVEYLIEVATRANFTRLVGLLDEVRLELNSTGYAPVKVKRRKLQSGKVANAKRNLAS